MVRTKPLSTRPKFLLFVRYTFHHNATTVSPRNLNVVEHHLRQGKKQLEMYEDVSVKDCWVSSEMKTWDEARRKSAA